jgi:hypothetical protein
MDYFRRKNKNLKIKQDLIEHGCRPDKLKKGSTSKWR